MKSEFFSAKNSEIKTVADNVILISQSFKNYVWYYYCCLSCNLVTMKEYVCKCFVLVMCRMCARKKKEKRKM